MPPPRKQILIDGQGMLIGDDRLAPFRAGRLGLRPAFVWCGQALQRLTLIDQAGRGNLACRSVNPRIGNLTEPARCGHIGGVAVRLYTGLLQAGGKRNPEAALHIADEALDLAFRFGAIRTGQTRQKTGMAGIVEKAGMEAVPARAIGVPFQNHRLHIIVQHLARHAAKGRKGVLMTPDQCLKTLVLTELDISRPAPAKRCHKDR
jgi:hypothetical protein